MDGMDDVIGQARLDEGEGNDFDAARCLASQHTTGILRETSSPTTSFFSLDESMSSQATDRRWKPPHHPEEPGCQDAVEELSVRFLFCFMSFLHAVLTE